MHGWEMPVAAEAVAAEAVAAEAVAVEAAERFRAHAIPPHRCASCGYTFDQATPRQGDRAPIAGDLSICYSCGLVTIFAEDLCHRDLTPEEWDALSDHTIEQLARLERARVERRQRSR